MTDTDFAAANPRRSILFVALNPEDAEAVANGLKDKARRWRLDFAPTTTEALRLLRSAPFDCVVMNLQARGIEPQRFFKEVMESSPEALRIGLTAQDERQTLQQVKAPVHQFLSRPLEPKVLTAVVARAFAAQDFLSQTQFRKLVDSLGSLPVLPAAYAALQDELAREDTSNERVGDLIATDMGLSTRVLQLVNSAFFGLAQTVAHPAEAMNYLGTETIRALVLSVSVFSQFNRVRLKTFNPELLWRHSWTIAQLARRLCEFEETERSIANEAFLAGLLHDMGKLVMAANYPSILEQNIAEAARRKVGLWEQEFLTHGASHAELGGYLLRRWGLPPAVIDAVTFHHRPTLARIRKFAAVTAVHVANGLSHALMSEGASIDGDNFSSQIDLGYLRTLGLEDRLEDWRTMMAPELERCEATAT